MKRLFVTTSIGGLGLCALLLVPLQGCTDLNETPISSITPSNFFHTEGEVLAALAGVYAGLRNTASEGEYWGVSEVSTDEIVVPTRGSDWYDNGTWLETHRQTWSASKPATLSFVKHEWNTAEAVGGHDAAGDEGRPRHEGRRQRAPGQPVPERPRVQARGGRSGHQCDGLQHLPGGIGERGPRCLSGRDQRRRQHHQLGGVPAGPRVHRQFHRRQRHVAGEHLRHQV